MKVLFVVPYAPTRVRARPLAFIRALTLAGHEVTVATLWSTSDDRLAIDRLSATGARVIAERLSASRSVYNCLRALPGTDPLQAHFSWSPALARRLAREVEETAFDVVHVEHLRGARYAMSVADALSKNGHRGVPVVWDSVDCITALFRETAERSVSRRARLAARIEAPRTAAYEAAMVSRFKRVLVTAETDRRQLEELAEAWSSRRRAPMPQAGRVVVVPQTVDVDYFAPGDSRREPTALVFHGKMSYHANVTAVVHLIQNVLPLVWKDIPDVRLWVVGQDPSPEILRLGTRCSDPFGFDGRGTPGPTRVLVTGGVDDVRPFLRNATVAVAPIQYGAGTQNKILEAFGCGTPVIASPQAVSALDVRAGEQLVLASDAREFAAATVRLLRDPALCARLGAAGRAFVERRHNSKDLAGYLTNVYRDARA